MGLNIGGNPAALAGARVAGDLFALRSRERADGPRLLGAPEPRERGGPFFQKEPQQKARVGFGEGTVSVPGAALDTIGRGVRNARQSVPTVEEIRQEHRARRAEIRAAAERREVKRPRRPEPPERPRRPEPPERPQRTERPQRRVQMRLPAPAAQARNFINQLDQTAAIAQARVTGQEIPAGPARASFEVNGQTFAFAAPNIGVQNPPGVGGNEGFRINIFV